MRNVCKRQHFQTVLTFGLQIYKYPTLNKGCFYAYLFHLNCLLHNGMDGTFRRPFVQKPVHLTREVAVEAL